MQVRADVMLITAMSHPAACHLAVGVAVIASVFRLLWLFCDLL